MGLFAMLQSASGTLRGCREAVIRTVALFQTVAQVAGHGDVGGVVEGDFLRYQQEKLPVGPDMCEELYVLDGVKGGLDVAVMMLELEHLERKDERVGRAKERVREAMALVRELRDERHAALMRQWNPGATGSPGV